MSMQRKLLMGAMVAGVDRRAVSSLAALASLDLHYSMKVMGVEAVVNEVMSRFSRQY
jgi:hypothetical protein